MHMIFNWPRPQALSPKEPDTRLIFKDIYLMQCF